MINLFVHDGESASLIRSNALKSLHIVGALHSRASLIRLIERIR